MIEIISTFESRYVERRGRRGLLTNEQRDRMIHGPEAARLLREHERKCGGDIRRRDLVGLSIGLGITACGMQAGAPLNPTPLTIWPSNILQWCRSDVVSTSGSNVTQFTDVSGQAKHYTPGTNGPTITATDASLSGLATINFAKATNQYLTSSLNLPSPSTTPTWVGGVFRWRTWTNNAYMIRSESAAGLGIRHGNTGDPSVRLINSSGALANTGSSQNQWVRFEALWTNAAVTTVGTGSSAERNSDYLMLQGTITDGVNTGGTHTATGRRISDSATSTDMDLAEIVYLNKDPTADEMALWELYLGVG